MPKYILVVLLPLILTLTSVHSTLDKSCNTVNIDSQLYLQQRTSSSVSFSSTANQSIKMKVAQSGRVERPFSPTLSPQESLLVGTQATKHLFSITQIISNDADRIKQFKVSPTDPSLLTIVWYSTSNYTEVTQTLKEKQQFQQEIAAENAKSPSSGIHQYGVHMNYYCKPGTYGVQHLNITVVFQQCPDMYFQWRKQCGTQATSAASLHFGLNLDLMIGSGGHQRFSLIENGVKMFQRVESKGSLQQAGVKIDQSALKQMTDAQAKQFLRSHNHEEMSFLIHNSQRVSVSNNHFNGISQKPLIIQKISVHFKHQNEKGQITNSKIRQNDIMMPQVFGPATQENLNILKGQDIPFLLDFNCIGQIVGEGWVTLTIQIKYTTPVQVEFFHRCHVKQSYLQSIEQTVKKDAILIGDVLLYLLTALVFLLTLFIVIYVCCMPQSDENIIKKAKNKLFRQIEILAIKTKRSIRDYFNEDNSTNNENYISESSGDVNAVGEQMTLIKPNNTKQRKKRRVKNNIQKGDKQVELEEFGFVLEEEEHLSIGQTIKNYGSLN